jgi:predicted O-methyltransferase YrrM
MSSISSDQTQEGIEVEKLVEQAAESETRLASILNDEPYEEKGVFNSELLLFISVVELLKPDRIVESGRARGHSTKVIAEYFENRDIEIISIEQSKATDDEKIARNKLKRYNRLQLEYGDSREIISSWLDTSTIILIDGPKGDEALKMALDLLKGDEPQAVFIHDLHRNTLHRDLSELLFNYTYFSDDETFVEEFCHLDDPCWDHLDDGWGPYLRKGEQIESYASTFGVFFNGDNPIDSLKEDNYRKFLEWNKCDFQTHAKSVLGETLPFY